MPNPLFKIFLFSFLFSPILISGNQEYIQSRKKENNATIKVAPHEAGKDQEPAKITDIDNVKILEAISFCKKQHLDTTVAFFIDMSIHSGKKRFFIVDLNQKVILHSGLCCHGAGKGSTEAKPVFSNDSGSNCTSLGKYKTGVKSYSNWGINIHYKLHGLEATNNNAFKRIVVLHSYTPIPDEEIYPNHLPLGWSFGCPVISDNLMTRIDNLLKNRKKNLLLWIY